MNILSKNNNLVKQLKSLKNRRSRENYGMFLIEGKKFVAEAIKQKANIFKIVVSKNFYDTSFCELSLILQNVPKHIDIVILDNLAFKQIADTQNPQGIIALAKLQYITDIQYIIKNGNGPIIILDKIQDPGNLGTIIRTADAVLASGIIISAGSVDIHNPKVLRSTMGSIFRVASFLSQDILSDLLLLKKSGMQIYAAHNKGDQLYFNVKFPPKSAIIIGNESNGISESIMQYVNHKIKIPMSSDVESLNASISAGLIMYEIVRQKSQTQ